ncbi:MAG: DUF6588 family protein [Candidatus Kryptoniota bacterium]
MQRNITKISVLLSMVLVFADTVCFAQSSSANDDLQSTLSGLAESAAQGYIAPIVSGFGADLNSGWVHRAPRPVKSSFDLEIGIVAMGSFFSAPNKSFDISAPYKFDYNSADRMLPPYYTGAYRDSVRQQIMKIPFTVTISGPTIVGSKKDSVKVSFSGGTATVTYNGVQQTVNVNPVVVNTGATGFLENLPALPMGAPQISLGTIYGTSVAFRFLPSVTLDNKLGNLSYFGYGFQHNPSVWFGNEMPVDLSLSFFTQTLKVGTIFESSAREFGIFASHRFGPGALNITPYLGLLLESSSMTVSYDLQTTGPDGRQITTPVSFSLNGQNTSRLTAGLSLKLIFIAISADYSFSRYNTASVGVGVII